MTIAGQSNYRTVFKSSSSLAISRITKDHHSIFVLEYGGYSFFHGIPTSRDRSYMKLHMLKEDDRNVIAS